MTKTNTKTVARFKDAQDRLVLQASDLSLETISNMVKNKAIDLEPKYQRRERWSAEQQSALIESFLLNIPIPPIYLAEEEFGIYSAIDGKQRLTAINQFMTDNLQLVGLDSFEEIEGAKFSDLPPELQNALRIRPYVRAITLLKQSARDLKYEVFTRLNKQGVPLNGQEIRNVLYRGNLNDLIYKLAENEFLRQQLKIKGNKSSSYQNMEDAEYVLRFLTLLEEQSKFTGSFRRSMDNFMEAQQKTSKQELDQLKVKFNYAIQACQSIWGEHSFKRASKDGWRDQFLAGMYDAQMIAVSRVDPDVVKAAKANRKSVIEATKQIFLKDAEFDDAVRQATNTISKIEYRIEKMIKLLKSKAKETA